MDRAAATHPHCRPSGTNEDQSSRRYFTHHPKASIAFYESALGYTHDAIQMPRGTYYLLKNGDWMRGGILQASNSDIPTMWLQCVTVDDCNAALRCAKKNGGTIVIEPMDAECVGRFGIFWDPLGAAMGATKPAGWGGVVAIIIPAPP